MPRVIIYILLFLANGCSDDAVLPRLSSDAVILAFGDSLTHGNGARPEESYPAVLEKLSGRQVINAGISGEETAAGLERLPGLLAEHQPQLMILCHGGNDFLRKNDPGKMEANVRAMINLARSEGIPVVLLGVPKPGLFLSSAEVYNKIAESSDVVFIEDLIADVLGDRSLKSDTVHPNKDGYRVMAENIHAVLGRAGAL
jgi:acyl-CoA thioesterase I